MVGIGRKKDEQIGLFYTYTDQCQLIVAEVVGPRLVAERDFKCWNMLWVEFIEQCVLVVLVDRS